MNTEDIEDLEMKKEQAEWRILGIAIDHYLNQYTAGCELCAAVKKFEDIIGGRVNLRALGMIYSQEPRN